MPSPASRFRSSPTTTRANTTRLARTFWIFSVTVLLACAGVAAPTPAIAAPDAITNPAQMPEPVAWQQCPNDERENAEHNLVRPFPRAWRIVGPWVVSGGTSELVCGNDRYGYYHIFVRHYVEWTQKSIKTSEDWQQVADYAIAEALSDPDVAIYREDRDTFCYSREIYTVNKVTGQVVDVFHPNVITRRGDGAIVTAYPSGTPCNVRILAS